MCSLCVSHTRILQCLLCLSTWVPRSCCRETRFCITIGLNFLWTRTLAVFSRCHWMLYRLPNNSHFLMITSCYCHLRSAFNIWLSISYFKCLNWMSWWVICHFCLVFGGPGFISCPGHCLSWLRFSLQTSVSIVPETRPLAFLPHLSLFCSLITLVWHCVVWAVYSIIK